MYQLTLYIILKFCVCQVPFANIFIYQYIKHTSSYPPSVSVSGKASYTVPLLPILYAVGCSTIIEKTPKIMLFLV